MENSVKVNEIVWEDAPAPFSGLVGDVFDRLEDGKPRQWYFNIWPTAHANDPDQWLVKHFIGEGGTLLQDCLTEEDAKKAAMEAKTHKVGQFIAQHTDCGKYKATSDMCFISEIINDLKNRDLWHRDTKVSTMLRDWRDELMKLAGVDDESEIQAIHAELCGAENWGLEDEEQDDDDLSDEEE